jgi:MoxR-like ATPase
MSLWQPTFIGTGDLASLQSQIERNQPWQQQIGPWRQNESDDGSNENAAFDHPRDYIAAPDLAHAVNTALLLGKPLLLTGRPGTGKTLLAERLAWELNLSPVLRFEAQSVSEAQNLFYHYDLVGRLGALQIERLRSGLRLTPEGPSIVGRSAPDDDVDAKKFLSFGPLGKAILLADPGPNSDLWPIAFPDAAQPLTAVASQTPLSARPSVVLIDEIDKASRDFPNDLLNGIDRLSFRIPELGNRLVGRVKDSAAEFRPIVIITSNSERELPEPFLRRCIYFNIPEPDKNTLAAILQRRLFPKSGAGGDVAVPATASVRAALPPLYNELLDFFCEFCLRQQDSLSYRPGTSELLDCARALLADPGVNPQAELKDSKESVKRRLGAIAKAPADQVLFADNLDAWQPAKA